MLSSNHFYHRIIRKLVVSFGSIFNDLKLYRYNKENTVEIERITVPLTYASKEKFIVRITQDPELTKEVQMTLPRMSFEMMSITYDPLRKVSQYQKLFSPVSGNNSIIKSVPYAPYNFEFNLNIYVRNTEDGAQLIEQILPYFSPDYTVTVDLIGLSNLKMDVPIILNSVSSQTDYEGSSDNIRMIVWSLNFTAKAYLYGPIDSGTGNGANKLIRTAYGNTYYDQDSTNYRTITMQSGGFGNYKTGELVYQGSTLSTATATAYVKSWNPTANVIVIEDINGLFSVNNIINGAATGASYNTQSFSVYSNKLSSVKVQPNPLTANVDDDFGFTETITEYPNL